MPRTLEVIDRLNSKPTGSESVDLAGALITFVLAMVGASERVKASAELVKAIAKICAARMDTAAPNPIDTQSAPPPFTSAQTTGPDSVLAEVNVRQVLDALAILTIEMTVADFLKLLERSVLVDGTSAICMTNSYYGSHPEQWSSVGWIHTILAGASLMEAGTANGPILTLHMPNATTKFSGMLGATLRVGAGHDSVSPDNEAKAAGRSSTIVGSKKLLVEHEHMCVTARVENDLRPALRHRGMRIKGKRRVPGFSVDLTRQADNTPLFSLFLISIEAKR